MPVSSVDQPSEDQLAARRQLDDARQGFRDRKRATRRKIIAGAALLAEAQLNPAVGQIVRGILQSRVPLIAPSSPICSTAEPVSGRPEGGCELL